ncbi:MAG: hypothetical protein CM1200mP39_11340 [Dehalococcoidia bacterium]|nr:MAG: hypothetical protein CM1200mP39_11340 [Dehalococcoidia bacterium]
MKVLLVGAGKTGRLTANALRRYGAEEIVVSVDRSNVAGFLPKILVLLRFRLKKFQRLLSIVTC